jgi:hypothetical protein
MSLGHERDRPPERRRSQRRHQTIDAFPRHTGWASPTVTRAVDIYLTVVTTMLKMVLGAFLGLVVFGCGWLIVQILSLP